jgi:hypothetical protein
VDNLNKKGMNKLVQCCFCGEKESIHHLFFECVDAKVVWSHVFEFLAFDIGADYMSVAAKGKLLLCYYHLSYSDERYLANKK